MAVAYSILVIAFHVLRDGTASYTNLGGIYFDERDRHRQRVEHRLVGRLEALGYDVHLQPRAA